MDRDPQLSQSLAGGHLRGPALLSRSPSITAHRNHAGQGEGARIKRNSPAVQGQVQRLIRALLLPLSIVAPSLWGQAATEVVQRRGPKSTVTDKYARGFDAATKYCQGCHLFPKPELLDIKTWREQVLPRMEIRMGLSPVEIERHPESRLLRATGLFPSNPMISTQEFSLIEDYYAAVAPEKPLPQEPRAEIAVGLKLFAKYKPIYRRAPPSTTLVHISLTGRRIYLGDAEARVLDILSSEGKLLHSLKLENIPASICETAQGIYVTLIGHFRPSEEHHAGLIFVERTSGGFQAPKVILSGLPRATHTALSDFNRDGKPDLVMSLYGNNAGRFSWFENVANARYKEHVLIPKSGAIRSVVHDFNGDNSPDLAVLIAQESEILYLLTNDGRGQFTSQAVYQKHPLFGHTYFEVADFNGDGRPDFLVTNGDNGEYRSPTKKYHGLRVYLNQGGSRFEESFFYPLNGAFKAMARDFDQDGDLDIAAISFFPDYEKSPEESFVYLENHGKNRFTAATFRECISGRWLTMDVGDLDGDGDLDIALGSYIRGPSEVPGFLTRDWEAFGPSIVVLENRLHW